MKPSAPPPPASVKWTEADVDRLVRELAPPPDKAKVAREEVVNALKQIASEVDVTPPGEIKRQLEDIENRMLKVNRLIQKLPEFWRRYLADFTNEPLSDPRLAAVQDALNRMTVKDSGGAIEMRKQGWRKEVACFWAEELLGRCTGRPPTRARSIKFAESLYAAVTGKRSSIDAAYDRFQRHSKKRPLEG